MRIRSTDSSLCSVDNGVRVMGYIRCTDDSFRWFGLWRTSATKGDERTLDAACEALSAGWHAMAERYPHRIIGPFVDVRREV